MKMIKLEKFPSDDGHIESILIGVSQVKISFQTWDARKLVIIFNEVKKVFSDEAVYGDIGEFRIEASNNNLKKYTFFSAWSDEADGEDKAVLIIEAGSMEIFQVGADADINSAIFDVGYDYIGGRNDNISRDDFIAILNNLSRDNRCCNNEWENKDISSYLEAIASWVEDMDGYFENMNLDMPENIDWQFIATLFQVGKIYE